MNIEKIRMLIACLRTAPDIYGFWANELERAVESTVGSEPEVSGYDPTEARRTVTVRWPDGKVLSYSRFMNHGETNRYLTDMLEYVRSQIIVALERSNNDEKPQDIALAILQAAMEVFVTETTPQPAIPPGYALIPINNSWLRAIDEDLASTHLGVANPEDNYDTARIKLNALICWHVNVALDPQVNGGWKLVPVEPTKKMIVAARNHHEGEAYLPYSIYTSMLAAAPEVTEVRNA